MKYCTPCFSQLKPAPVLNLGITGNIFSNYSPQSSDSVNRLSSMAFINSATFGLKYLQSLGKTVRKYGMKQHVSTLIYFLNVAMTIKSTGAFNFTAYDARKWNNSPASNGNNAHKMRLIEETFGLIQGQQALMGANNKGLPNRKQFYYTLTAKGKEILAYFLENSL